MRKAGVRGDGIGVVVQFGDARDRRNQRGPGRGPQPLPRAVGVVHGDDLVLVRHDDGRRAQTDREAAGGHRAGAVDDGQHTLVVAGRVGKSDDQPSATRGQPERGHLVRRRQRDRHARVLAPPGEHGAAVGGGGGGAVGCGGHRRDPLREPGQVAGRGFVAVHRPPAQQPGLGAHHDDLPVRRGCQGADRRARIEVAHKARAGEPGAQQRRARLEVVVAQEALDGEQLRHVQGCRELVLRARGEGTGLSDPRLPVGPLPLEGRGRGRGRARQRPPPTARR